MPKQEAAAGTGYRPAPIDVSRVELTPELEDLADRLARNVHEVWAQQRMDAGWQYGSEWDDTRQTHPYLVTFEALPESERNFDRDMALGTICSMLALGYQIESPLAGNAGPLDPLLGAEPDADRLLRLLSGPGAQRLSTVLALWQMRERSVWSRHPELYRVLGERILSLGEALLAYDVVGEGLEYLPGDVRLRQLQGLALARSGATEKANEIAQTLQQAGQTDEETLGLLARTHKDLAARAPSHRERESHLRGAMQAYLHAYERSGGYWTGINSATTALLLGEKDRAQSLAREVRSRCLQEVEALKVSRADPYWVYATLGEAALILDDTTAAEAWYTRAQEVAHGRHGVLSTTRRNAKLLTSRLHQDWSLLDRCLVVPRVAVFTGHRIDRPKRRPPRFPSGLESAVRDAIRERVRQLDTRIGFASAACGADLLFLETILESGGEAHVVLPYDQDQLIQDNVATGGADWGDRFLRVLGQAAGVVTAAKERMSGGGISYAYANLLLLGLACLRAEQLDTDLCPLALWDGEPGDGPGGTASAIGQWEALGHKVDWIDLSAILRKQAAVGPSVRTGDPSPLRQVNSEASHGFAAEIRAMLFADTVGFSELTEVEIPRFVRHFVGTLRKVTARYHPLARNTWGDGLFLVFANVAEAGRFALEACDLVRRTDWTAHDLPGDLAIRIALHAGPVYGCSDPITGQPNYLGTHVSRAARIEPITPPNHVYASQAFAALAAAERVSDFRCDYVGQTPLAKGYGTFPTYHVRRR